MSFDEKEWDYERDRLKQVIDEIKLQMDKNQESAENFKKNAISAQKEMWEDVRLTPSDMSDTESMVQAMEYQSHIASQARSYRFSKQMVERLEKLYSSPYFARIDFIEEDEKEAEKIYIGLYTLTGSESGDFLVYDWRAPISSMFYDYEIGKASYKCPAGTIEGEILLKRQYKIANQQIEYMFDSSVKIDDDILQEILGKSVDNRMKTIVTSIQREQNSVIRDENHHILIVQGAAGSGKTSIALHRAAYILYKYRESLNPENIIIFSPNQVFNDYISNVLPELGEENMLRATFRQYFNKMLEPGTGREDMHDQMEYLLTRRATHGYDTRVKSIKYKGSRAFIKVLKNYVAHLESTAIELKDIRHKEILIISKEELSQLFTSEYARLPLGKRLDKIRQRLFYLLVPHEEERMARVRTEMEENESYLAEKELKALSYSRVKEEFRPLKDEIERMTSFNLYESYVNLFRDRELFARMCGENPPQFLDDICYYTEGQLANRFIRYEDMAPLLYLKGALETFPDASSIKHIVIDEAQDYTPLQFEILKQCFGNCNMTILGDLNQSINNYMNVGTYEAISDIFSDRITTLVKLSKSYRSTRQITDFCRQMLPKMDDVEYLNRPGEKPKAIKLEEKSKLAERVIEDVKALQGKGYRSIGIICKSSQDSESFYKALNEHIHVNIVTKDDTVYETGVVVIPSYMAKGLEFDAVLVCSAGKADYGFEDERRLLYTVCTRALHVLHLYYANELSPFIREVDSELYEMQG